MEESSLKIIIRTDEDVERIKKELGIITKDEEEIKKINKAIKDKDIYYLFHPPPKEIFAPEIINIINDYGYAQKGWSKPGWRK